MKLFAFVLVAFCLTTAGLFGYLTNNDAIFGIFVGFDTAYLLSMAVLYKLTKAPKNKEFDSYRSAENF